MLTEVCLNAYQLCWCTGTHQPRMRLDRLLLSKGLKGVKVKSFQLIGTERIPELVGPLVTSFTCNTDTLRKCALTRGRQPRSSGRHAGADKSSVFAGRFPVRPLRHPLLRPDTYVKERCLMADLIASYLWIPTILLFRQSASAGVRIINDTVCRPTVLSLLFSHTTLFICTYPC
jgi:hypothetical protein